MSLSGTPVHVDERILCVHERSTTVRNDDDLRKNVATFWLRNEEYYKSKWGGGVGKETYDTPFGT